MPTPSRPLYQRIVDRCYRHAFRLAYPYAKKWWRNRRQDGVQVVVLLDDQVLAVLHSYRPGWTVPGGGINPGEDPLASAARELWEETGVAIAPADLTLVATQTLSRNRGFCYVYEARLTVEPTLRIDCREIIAAQFMPVRTLIQAQDTYVTGYLRARMRSATPVSV